MSSPYNLAQITPPHLGFQILSAKDDVEKMHAGQIIEYTVSPILGIKLYWVTEITHVNKGVFFVDEQRFGPYSFWHHKHFFKEIPGGVEMTDIVHYKLPFGRIGQLVNKFLVKKQLEIIFAYRNKKVDELLKMENS